MRHRASSKFWRYYRRLPLEVQKLADNNFALLKSDIRHPSLHFKKMGRFWSARVGIHHRAVAVERGTDLVCFGSAAMTSTIPLLEIARADLASTKMTINRARRILSECL